VLTCFLGGRSFFRWYLAESEYSCLDIFSTLLFTVKEKTSKQNGAVVPGMMVPVLPDPEFGNGVKIFSVPAHSAFSDTEAADVPVTRFKKSRVAPLSGEQCELVSVEERKRSLTRGLSIDFQFGADMSKFPATLVESKVSNTDPSVMSSGANAVVFAFDSGEDSDDTWDNVASGLVNDIVAAEERNVSMLNGMMKHAMAVSSDEDSDVDGDRAWDQMVGGLTKEYAAAQDNDIFSGLMKHAMAISSDEDSEVGEDEECGLAVFRAALVASAMQGASSSDSDEAWGRVVSGVAKDFVVAEESDANMLSGMMKLAMAVSSDIDVQECLLSCDENGGNG
jgi:hypothetical protein